MIEELRIRNFKCFREQTIPFGGLTVLAGLNGTGKSSAIQAILALRQSCTHRHRTALGRQTWRGPLVNLGSFSDVIHDDATGDTVRVEASFGVAGQAYFEERHPQAGRQSGGYDEEAAKWMLGDLYYLSADRLGPRQTLPYAEEGHASATPLGKRGEHVLWYLDQAGQATVASAVRHPSESKKTLAAQTNAWLGSVSPGAELRIKVVPEADLAVGGYRFSRPGDVPSRAFRAGNVGFGVSYALPPIVALLAPKRDLLHSVDHHATESPAVHYQTRPAGKVGELDPISHLVIIENPEAHVHPGGQTSLAELAARAAAGGSQVVLETHSDHILDGVRLAVRDGILSPEQVVINYFEREGLDVRITTPVLNRNGRLDVWPEGFFDQHERNLSRLIGPPAAPGSVP